MKKLLYEKESYQVRRAIFDVRKQLKSGWSEEVYHQALKRSLEVRGIPFVSKERQPFYHRQVEVHIFEPDLVVWDKIVLELKYAPYAEEFSGGNFAQIIHYLKFLEKKLGLLVNFGPTRAYIKRVLWEESPLQLEENYEAFRDHMPETDRAELRQVRQAILAIAQQYGLGYPESMYRKMIAIELEHMDMKCGPEILLEARWKSEVLCWHRVVDCLHVADSYLIIVRSLLKQPPTFEFARMKTYLAALGLSYGYVVNFGHKKLQIFAVKAG